MTEQRRTLPQVLADQAAERAGDLAGVSESARLEAPLPNHWLALEDLSATPEVLEADAHREFAEGAVSPDAQGGLGRRGFLTLSGSVAAALSLGGCIRRPKDEIVPFVHAPEYRVPGRAQHYATVLARGGDATGLLVTSHQGRPTKIEGNAQHPASAGAADIWAQAAPMALYDPDRSQQPKAKPEALPQGRLAVTRADAASTHGDVEAKDWKAALAGLSKEYGANQGQGLRLLVRPSSSPTLHRLRRAFRERFPKAAVHTYSPVGDWNAEHGIALALGSAAHPLVDYARANVILSVDSDFLHSETGALRAARGFGSRRKPDSPKAEMNRLYVVESTVSVTGASADHRLRLASRDAAAYLLGVARALAPKLGGDLASFVASTPAPSVEVPEVWWREVAADLLRNRGRGVVVVGSRQPAAVHALAALLNRALSNEGPVVRYQRRSAAPEGAELHSAGAATQLEQLATDVRAGQVSTLVMLGGNPVYDAPADLKFATALQQQGLKTIHLSRHFDETSRSCTWHVPELTEFESWGDQRSLDGSVSIQQPLIAPLWMGWSEAEVLSGLLGDSKSDGLFLVQTTWRADPGAAFEREWRRTLQRGVASGAMAGQFAAQMDIAAQMDGEVDAQPAARLADLVAAYKALKPSAKSLAADNLELVFAADNRIGAGEHANNPWLLETPDPITKLVWDNAALVSPSSAEQMQLANGDLVRIELPTGESAEVPVFALPGHADWSLTLPLGWGRTAAGEYARGAGSDVYPLRRSDALGFVDGAKVSRVGKGDLVQTQTHGRMEGRPIAIDATLEQYREQPNFPQWKSVKPSTLPLWKEVDYSEGHKWGMTIDLSACTGCNACAVACQSENNIPFVGKEQVRRGRQMAWLRIDRYFVGDADDPDFALQPVGCQQCEEAPCENVCPVNATAHTPEGLNDMSYNRCVGTRYCANNCPYKVRRFNYLAYQSAGDPHGELPKVHEMQFNPNVTVRMRGVMEKCTYCVQRIQETKIAAKRDGRAMSGWAREGESSPPTLQSACQQTCPTQAIVFGDLNDPESKVAKLAARDRSYQLLAELGTQPRTTFLGKIRNRNPAMKREAASKIARGPGQHGPERNGFQRHGLES